MKFKLLHIYGPIAIHSYGLFIALGIAVFSLFIRRHKKFKQLNLHNHFAEILMVGILAGYVGGRLLSIISQPEAFKSVLEMIAFWQGGFSVLGSVLGILLILPWYLKRLQIPVLPLFDLAAIYGPLLQAIARIGCFFAGCCHGITSNLPWAVTYTDTQSIAPLYTHLHPTQLYSSATLFIIFLLMYFVFQHQFKKPGQLLASYLMLAGAERFIIDFWRADRIFINNPFFTSLSFTQMVALGLMISAGLVFIIQSYKKSYQYSLDTL